MARRSSVAREAITSMRCGFPTTNLLTS
jgi:hypothetical protein